MKFLKSKKFILALILIMTITSVFGIKMSLKSKADSELVYTNRGVETKFTDEEFRLYVALIYAEAQAEPYEGKVAVANVILNRIYSDEFPNNLYDVVYEPRQFSPVTNGALDKHLWEYDSGKFTTSYHLETIKAAKEAMKGVNNIGDRLFFQRYWPKVDYSDHPNRCIIKNHIFW